MPAATRKSVGTAKEEPSRDAGPSRSPKKPATNLPAKGGKGSSSQTGDDADEPEEPWTSVRRIFVSRTLQLHTLSPLHVPKTGSVGGSGKGVTSGTLSRGMFDALSSELRSYINIRLSDGMSVLHVAAGPSIGGSGGDLTGQREDAMLGGDSNLPVAKRRRIGDTVGSAQISAVRMGWLPELDLVNAQDSRDPKRAQRIPLDESSQAWAIEIELHRPPEPSQKGKKQSKAAAARAKAMKAIRLGDLCHLIFLPSSSGAERATTTSNVLSYPVLVTKACTNAAPDVNRAVLAHALNWVQARFDCRVSTAAGSAARKLRTTAVGADPGAEVSAGLEGLAEKIITQARGEKDEVDRATSRGRYGPRTPVRSEEERASDSAYAAGPVELAFNFPSELWDDLVLDGSKVPGPAPELNALIFTVPWPVCMRLLNNTPPDTPLLPALTAYLSQHTSLDLSPLTLSRIGAAGINFGLTASACRVKFYDLELADHVGAERLAEMQRSRIALVLRHLRALIEAPAEAH